MRRPLSSQVRSFVRFALHLHVHMHEFRSMERGPLLKRLVRLPVRYLSRETERPPYVENPQSPGPSKQATSVGQHLPASARSPSPGPPAPSEDVASGRTRRVAAAMRTRPLREPRARPSPGSCPARSPGPARNSGREVPRAGGSGAVSGPEESRPGSRGGWSSRLPWRTILVSTGEQSASSCTTHHGAAARVLAARHPPFGTAGPTRPPGTHAAPRSATVSGSAAGWSFAECLSRTQRRGCGGDAGPSSHLRPHP
jgi:hypothetical protein